MSDSETSASSGWSWKAVVGVAICYAVVVFGHGLHLSDTSGDALSAPLDALFFTATAAGIPLGLAFLGRLALRGMEKDASSLMFYDVAILAAALWGIFVHGSVWSAGLRGEYGASEGMIGLILQYPVLFVGWLIAAFIPNETED